KATGIELRLKSFFQPLLLLIRAPVESCNSINGLVSGLATPNPLKLGPIPLINTSFEATPCNMKPPINTRSPVCTTPRVEIFSSACVIVGVGVGVGLADRDGETVGVGVGEAEAIGPMY